MRVELEADRDEAVSLADSYSEKVESLSSECKALEGRVASLLSLETQLGEAKAELAAARKDAIEAREEAARLGGQLDSAKDQMELLWSRLDPKAGSRPPQVKRPPQR